MSICDETGLPNEWDATQASHVEAFAPIISKSVGQAGGSVIDFIDADAAGK